MIEKINQFNIPESALSLPENLMRSPKLSQSIQEMQKKWPNLFRADIGQPLDKNLTINDSLLSVFAEISQIIIADFQSTRSYSPFSGNPQLKEKYSQFIGKKWDFEADRESIIIGNGASEMMWATVSAFFEKGDVILTPDPHYNPFDVYLAQKQIQWLPITTNLINGYHFTEVDLEQNLEKYPYLARNLKAIYICNPNNPTGTVYSFDELSLLVDFALRQNLLIIADNVYALYNQSTNPNFFQFLNQLESEKKQKVEKQLIAFDSMSKLAHLPGIRIGFSYIPNPQLRELIGRILGARGNPNNISQLISIRVLEELIKKPKILEEVAQVYQQKQKTAFELLTSNNLITLPNQKPEATFYLTLGLPFSAEDLLNWTAKHYQGSSATTFVPMTTDTGSFFNHDQQQEGRSQIRICLGLDQNLISKAITTLIDQINQFFSSKN